MLRYIPSNSAGQDFMVGDLHSCLDRLEARLKAIGFDPARDQLFSIGNLVDRGPNSLGGAAPAGRTLVLSRARQS